jgi:signal peptidase I
VSKVDSLWGRGARRWTFRLVFAASMSVAVLAYGIPLWYHLHGQRILVVTGGSMEGPPGSQQVAGQFNVGDAVVITKIAPTELRIGQVVAFRPTGLEGTLTTHRIIDLVEKPDLENVDGNNREVKDVNGNVVTTRYIRTKGDANSDPDPDLTPIANVRGAVSQIRPGWGYFLGYAHSPLGRFLVFAPPLILLLGAELLSWRRRPDQPQHSEHDQRREHRDAFATTA